MKFRQSLLILFLTIPFTSKAQIYEGVASWRYVPVDGAYWQKIEEARLKKDFVEVISLSEGRQKKAKTELEKAEAQYAIASACLELEYYYCAYDYAMGVLTQNPGSMPAVASLYILEALVQRDAIIEDEIQRVLNIANFKEVPEDLVPMVSFYVFRDNLNRNLKEWQQESFKKISVDSYWKLRLDFFRALLLVQSNKMAQAEKYMQGLEKSAEKFPRLQNTIRLQRARLLYGMGKFKEADEIYGGFLSDSREFGKILLERAWVKYSQKDYSLSLGMIESLKAPYFRAATHPEQYLLLMVAYRDICHYDAVVAAHREFQSVFKPWIDHLKENKPLFENKALLSMVLMQSHNLRLGNMIGTVRAERDRLDESSFSSAFKKDLRKLYDTGETRWKDFASQALEQDLKAASIEFLEYVEQAKLLDYISGLDKFRVKARFEDRQYKAPEAENYAIQRLFWPVSGEYWWDEVNSYRVLASDRCGGG